MDVLTGIMLFSLLGVLFTAYANDRSFSIVGTGFLGSMKPCEGTQSTGRRRPRLTCIKAKLDVLVYKDFAT